MKMGLLEYVDTEAREALSEEEHREIIDLAISLVNREFELSTLRSPSEEDRRRVRERIGALVRRVVRQRGLSGTLSATQEALLADEVARMVLGLGFLDLLLPPARTDLTEIAITPDGKVWVKKKGEARFELRPSKVEVFRVLDALLGPQGRALNEATPSVDAKLPRTGENPGGGRIKALHPSIAPGAGYPSVNIRLFEQKPVPPEKIIRWGEMSEEMMEELARAVRHYLRIFISGGTGTGKTTLLAALCNFIPREDRIVKIEDPEEIYIDHPHVVTIEARPSPPGSDVPPYTVRDGVDDSLRMTPDWLIVGEVRKGDAALALFRAQMSDHPGMTTFHADSPRAAVHRLSVIMFADAGVRFEAAKNLFAQAVDVVVQIIYDPWGIRRVAGIYQVERELKGGDVKFTPVYLYDQEASTKDHPVWKKVGEITRRRM